MSSFMDDLLRICQIPEAPAPQQRQPSLPSPRRSNGSNGNARKQRMIEEYVPPKLQGTPLEDLIISSGGGTSNAELGLVDGPAVFHHVPGIDDSDLMDFDFAEKKERGSNGNNGKHANMTPMDEARQYLEKLAQCFGGKILWG